MGELKFVCNCSCGYELHEDNITIIIDPDCCEMDFKAKCPKCGKKESVSLPHEMKMRIIHKKK